MKNFLLGLAAGLTLVILVPVGVNAYTSVYDIIRSNGLIVGKQGKEAKIELNGSISNTTKDKNKKSNPVTINDNVQINGEKLQINSVGGNIIIDTLGIKIKRPAKYSAIPITLGPDVNISENLSVSGDISVSDGINVSRDLHVSGDISAGKIRTGIYDLEETAKIANQLNNFIDCLSPSPSASNSDPITVEKWKFCLALYPIAFHLY